MSQDSIAPDQDLEPKREPSILEMKEISFRDRSETGMELRRADLSLRRGEMVIIQLEASTRTRDVTSMIQGLTQPSEGSVLFCGESWLGEDYDRHFQMRSRIGRVFEGQAWIENLNVDENVTLSRRHHGASTAAIQEDVHFWTTRLGIKGLSPKRPAFVEPSLLQVHQWVRAFMGSPAMVILENPLQYLSSVWPTRLVDAINVLRGRGSAVLWFNPGADLPTDPFAEPLVRLQLNEGRFLPIDGGSIHE